MPTSTSTSERQQRKEFIHRSETFGFDRGRPWAMDVFRLLFHVPRAYQPIVDAWEKRYPGAKRSLHRLVDAGFVAYQDPVIVDTSTGELADTESRRVTRYVIARRGRRLLAYMRDDPRVLEDRFPNATGSNLDGLAELLDAFHIDNGGKRFGLSAAHAIRLSGMAPRTCRWWINRLIEKRYLRQLSDKHADVRAVIPAHWRVTRVVTRQLRDVVRAFPDQVPAGIESEFRLSRRRFLDDIDPARVDVSGATDYDHDVIAQRILGALLVSPRCAAKNRFVVEPRLMLPADTNTYPWAFTNNGNDHIFYQPDAEMRETEDGGSRVSVVEYERFQSRRDAWSHCERFIGYLHTRTLPFERGVLRFVVDSPSRVRSYVQLIEAFADHMLERPDLMCANPVTLAVASVDRVTKASDPLDERNWYRIELPQRGDTDTGSKPAAPVLHKTDDTPYDEFFARPRSN